MGNRDRAIDVRIEALRAAVQMTAPQSGMGSLLIHAAWAYQFLQTGQQPEIDSAVTGRLVGRNKV